MIARGLGMAVHLALMVAASVAFGAWASRVQRAGLVVLALALSGCAATFTTAWGADAAARLFAPPSASCEAKPLGTKQTVTEVREGKLGPDNVTTKTVSEPAVAGAAPLAESHGSAVSETGGGVIRTVFGFLGGIAKGLLTFWLP